MTRVDKILAQLGIKPDAVLFEARFLSRDEVTVLQLCISIDNHLKLKKIMSDQDKFSAQLDRIDAATSAIASELTTLKDDIQGQGLPNDVEQSVLTRLTAAADKLEGIAKPDAPAAPAADTAA